MESLYVIALRYLRNNYRLINFTALSAEIAEDVYAIMIDPHHLSLCVEVKCRRGHTVYGIDTFIVEHYPDSKWVTEIKIGDMNRFDMIRADIADSRFRVTIYGHVYDKTTDKFYKVDYSFMKPFTHGVYKSEFNELTGNDDSDDSDDCGDVSPNCQFQVVEDQAFDEFPGVIELIEKQPFAEQLKIPRRMFLRMPFSN